MKAWTLVLASLGLFMTALDTLVVATALPVLRVDLHASLGDLEWTVNAFNLALACFLLTGAALGDRFGRRRTYAIGIAAFTAASAVAAVAPDMGVLIAARAFQGAGAAIVTPLTLTLISQAFPAEKRGAAIGLWGGIAGLAVASGPLVGGAIIDGVSWHWIFWVNVPIGLALVPLSLTRLTESFGPRLRLDIPGVVLAGGGALGLTWGLVRAGSVGWGSAEVIGALAAGAALLALFPLRERRAASPMIPLEFFRHRGFAPAIAAGFFMTASLLGALFLMTQFFQTALGHSPLQAGLRLLPWTGSPIVVAPLAGLLADRVGNRPLAAAGLALQAAGLAWIGAIAAPDIGYGRLGLALGIAGVGISLCLPAVSNAVMGSVPLAEAGVASGTSGTVRQLGGVFGVAVLAAVFARHGVYASPQAFVDRFGPALDVGAGLSIAGVAATLLLPRTASARADVVQSFGEA